MGQLSYIIGWAFQIAAIPEPSAVHPRVSWANFFWLMVYIVTPLHSTGQSHYQNSWTIKSVPWLQVILLDTQTV